MAVVNTRVDERLIHGQVAGIWSSNLGTHRIVVANDEAAADKLQKATLRMAAPQSIRLSVLTVEDAAKNILSGRYGEQRVFLIFKNPTDAKRYLKSGGEISELNVGNMSYHDGKQEVAKSIYVSPDEIKVFRDIDEMGTTVVAQLVPNNPKTQLMPVLIELEKGLK